jgi:hypothetical protein
MGEAKVKMVGQVRLVGRVRRGMDNPEGSLIAYF